MTTPDASAVEFPSDYENFVPPLLETATILLVDDDVEDAELVRRAATGGNQMDLSIVHCTSSADALDILRRQKFDLVMIDYWLGFETSVQLIKTIHDEYALPIVLLTGFDTPDVRRCGFRAGIAGFLAKDSLSVHGIESAVLGALNSPVARTGQ
ncbi:MAG: response regulator [Methylobacteriaceae bacterium]|nr:response regulator [Methylobacteriaceae bacterium]